VPLAAVVVDGAFVVAALRNLGKEGRTRVACGNLLATAGQMLQMPVAVALQVE
jgi:hypothetical protein